MIQLQIDRSFPFWKKLFQGHLSISFRYELNSIACSVWIGHIWSRMTWPVGKNSEIESSMGIISLRLGSLLSYTTLSRLILLFIIWPRLNKIGSLHDSCIWIFSTATHFSDYQRWKYQKKKVDLSSWQPAWIPMIGILSIFLMLVNMYVKYVFSFLGITLDQVLVYQHFASCQSNNAHMDDKL